MQGDFWIVNTKHKLETVIAHIKAEWDKHHWLKIQIQVAKTRTKKQNDALHAWFRDVARELNSRGISCVVGIGWGGKEPEKFIETDWTEISVKKFMWLPLQEALYGEKKTRRLEGPQLTQIFEYINRKFAEQGFHVPFGREFEDARSETTTPRSG